MSEPTSTKATFRVMLVSEPSGGGSGRHVVDLAQGLTALGHSVVVVYSPIRAEPMFVRELEGLPVFAVEALPMRRAVGPWDIATARSLRRIIDRLGPFDVIHGHSSKAGALGRLAAPRGAARIYTPHAFRTMDPATSLLARLVYGGVETVLGRFVSDAIITVSPEEAEHARALGIPDAQVHTVVNGLASPPMVDREVARTALGLNPGDIAVGFVGRLCLQKDPVRFAEAVRLARARDPRVRGVVLGDGDLKAATVAAGGEALSVHSGLNAREYLPALDLFVMTSRYEAMPYVLLEALQAGLPIVSTKVGGTSLTVEQQGNGCLVSIDASPHVIADNIMEGVDFTTRVNWSNRSRMLSEDFTAEKMVASTHFIYEKIWRRVNHRISLVEGVAAAAMAT